MSTTTLTMIAVFSMVGVVLVIGTFFLVFIQGFYARLDNMGGELGKKIEAQGSELCSRIDALGARLDAQGSELSRRIDDLGARLDAQTERIDNLGARLDAQTERIDKLTERIVDHIATHA